MRIEGRRLGQIRNVVFRAAFRALERELPGEDPDTALGRAVVMEMLETYLGEDFREMMAKDYGVVYPLNIETA